MEPLKRVHERQLGDRFINWHNQEFSTGFGFSRVGDDPPDLVYQDHERELPLEITTAYHDQQLAKARWDHARGRSLGNHEYSLSNPDEGLLGQIQRIIESKRSKQYPARCWLVINIYPDLMAAGELRFHLPTIRVPTDCGFEQIWIAGDFPQSGADLGGLHCMPVFPRRDP